MIIYVDSDRSELCTSERKQVSLGCRVMECGVQVADMLFVVHSRFVAPRFIAILRLV